MSSSSTAAAADSTTGSTTTNNPSNEGGGEAGGGADSSRDAMIIAQKEAIEKDIAQSTPLVGERYILGLAKGSYKQFVILSDGFPAYTRIIINTGHREIGLVLAVNFFPKKSSPGR